MNPRVIKTEGDYEKALNEVKALILKDPEPGSKDADRLDVLTILIQNYEEKKFTFDSPDPISAIKFRMTEQGLQQRDLIPYIGSRSKVSEVLSGKRPLAIEMIRALNKGLGIPTEILIKDISIAKDDKIEWNKFPVAEIAKRKWIRATPYDIRTNKEKLIKEFLNPLKDFCPQAILCRRSIVERTGRFIDRYALVLWIARILIKAKQKPISQYVHNSVNDEFIKQILRLSTKENGPLVAQRVLAEHGIALVIEPHLPKTHLDGTAMLDNNEKPVIGLTIRYDRIDNFWFNLVHELVHVSKHLKNDINTIIDDLDSDPGSNSIEREADRITQEIIIPRSLWKRSNAYRQRTPEAVRALAKKIQINPIIIAGRIRHDAKNYLLLSQMVGKGEVRKLFSDIKWPGEK